VVQKSPPVTDFTMKSSLRDPPLGVWCLKMFPNDPFTLWNCIYVINVLFAFLSDANLSTTLSDLMFSKNDHFTKTVCEWNYVCGLLCFVDFASGNTCNM